MLFGADDSSSLAGEIIGTAGTVVVGLLALAGVVWQGRKTRHRNSSEHRTNAEHLVRVHERLADIGATATEARDASESARQASQKARAAASRAAASAQANRKRIDQAVERFDAHLVDHPPHEERTA